jgi:ABC-type Fe3+-hydroxamate transport system substrate-binding protein
LIDEEYKMGLHTTKPYNEFAERVNSHKESLVNLIRSLRSDGKTVYGYGASTKGNVMLQWCGLTSDDIIAIGEVNPDKYGCVTPGTNIPIIPESEVKAINPDYMIVLPWHFRNGILQREKEYRNSGGKFIFPLPYIEIV